MDKTKVYLQYGFFWWWDKHRNDWFVGCAPAFGKPVWWKD
jgi:hypothetical protein